MIGKVSLDKSDKDTLSFIKKQNAYQIDWSNICDYMTNKQFFDIAKEVSCDETAHTCHMMNWPQRVYGTFLYDFGENA